MTLGNRIAQNRKRLNMTQDQLAEKLGITAQAVSKWENDLSCPDISTLPVLADIFGITIDELLGREEPQKVYEGQVVQAEDPEEDTDEDDENGWVFKWDGGRRGSLGFALWVVLLGGLLLADNLLHLDVGFWSLAWPSFLLMMGLFHGKGFSFGRLCFVLLGGYCLVNNMGLMPLHLTGDIIWPGLVILFGLSLVLEAMKKPKKSSFHFSGKGKKSKNDCFADERSFNCNISFGENHYLVTADALEEGNANVSFGELTVDLSGCQKIGQPCWLGANCSFGELEILVPRKYRVELSESTAFADVQIEGRPDAERAGIITIEANVSFGQITMRYV